MVMKRKTQDNDALTPLLLLAIGRGGSGKTVMETVLIERARRAGRTVRVADLDRTNQSLSHYFADAATAPDATDEAILMASEHFVDGLVGDRVSGVMDLGGGDLVGTRILHELGIVEFLSEHDVKTTVIFTLGSDVDYLAPFRRLWGMQLLRGANIVFVLNEALAELSSRGRDGFQQILDHPDFGAAIDDGAGIIVMPKLRGARLLAENRLRFYDAAEGRPAENGFKLLSIQSAHVRAWLRQMETQMAAIEGALP